MSRTMPNVPLLVESSLSAKTAGSGSKVSLLSKMARSVLPGVRNELIGDVRDMIAGFLKDKPHETVHTVAAALLGGGGGEGREGFSARWAWVPLKN